MKQPFYKLFNAGTSEGAVKGWASRVRSAIRDAHHPDTIGTDKSGNVVARRGYFYRHGTSQDFADKIQKTLAEKGIEHGGIEHGDHWAPFRGGASTARSSHFHVTVRPPAQAAPETIPNSGTSDGVRKAWLTRKGNNPTDTRNLFEKHVSRKADGWNEVSSMDWNRLDPAQQDALTSKPKLSVAGSAQYPLAIELADPPKHTHDIEYVMSHTGKHYYVNTEGYDYPRYMAEIKHLPPEHQPPATPGYVKHPRF